jgi:hypothetical protein
MSEENPTKEEITKRLEEIATMIAKETNKILQLENCMASQVGILITNVMGVCQVSVDVKTTPTGDAALFEKVIQDIAEKVGIPVKDPKQDAGVVDAKLAPEMVDELIKNMRKM